MLIPILLLWFWFETWRADRALAAHKRAIIEPQLRAAEQAMKFQREQFEADRKLRGVGGAVA